MFGFWGLLIFCIHCVFCILQLNCTFLCNCICFVFCPHSLYGPVPLLIRVLSSLPSPLCFTFHLCNKHFSSVQQTFFICATHIFHLCNKHFFFICATNMFYPCTHIFYPKHKKPPIFLLTHFSKTSIVICLKKTYQMADTDDWRAQTKYRSSGWQIWTRRKV